MAARIQRGYGPPKPSATPDKPVLDRFGMALVGNLINHTSYSDDISGFPVKQTQPLALNPANSAMAYARRSLLGVNPDASITSSQLYSAGARIIHLAQCVREAGLCEEYLQYTTLPEDNNSGLFGLTLPGGSRYVGDIRGIYDETQSTLVYTAPMFTAEDRDQYDNHPLIPFRLAYYIKAFMDEAYKGS